jgi:ketosteroid isomerase-like protein
MALAGHSNMATTQRYIDLRPAMLKAAVELVSVKHVVVNNSLNANISYVWRMKNEKVANAAFFIFSDSVNKFFKQFLL